MFVFRVPRLKKRKHGGIIDDTNSSTKARGWVQESSSHRAEEKRVTHVKNQSGPQAEEDDWHLPKVKFKEEWWRGHTTFYIQGIEDARNYVAEKREQDEVSLAKESDRDKEDWNISDLSEWNKVTQSEQSRCLDLETSRQVRTELSPQRSPGGTSQENNLESRRRRNPGYV